MTKRKTESVVAFVFVVSLLVLFAVVIVIDSMNKMKPKPAPLDPAPLVKIDVPKVDPIVLPAKCCGTGCKCKSKTPPLFNPFTIRCPHCGNLVIVAPPKSTGETGDVK